MIVGLPGPALEAATADALRALDPIGVILFARNVETGAQLAGLAASVRRVLGTPHRAVLVDQEGGRVARLKGNHFRHPPAAGRFGQLWDRDPAAAVRAAFLNARLMAHDLAGVGIDVDCAPVCDLAVEGAHGVIGDRAFHRHPRVVAVLARATARGLLEGGVQPVMKHIPGHGRARSDSHLELPVVEASRAELARDAAPFRALAGLVPWAMTAHVLYPALDGRHCATLSPAILGGTVRRSIGFHGLLVSDDLRMKALAGGVAATAAAALAAGCDLVLDCAPGAEDWPALAALPPMRAATWRRIARARRLAARAFRPFDPASAAAELGAALALV